ncbi:hypothetical protein NDU88_003069 [Pleurodeles waltl]|uniref:Uncharacterized protein n=1 Tax=Pleurodeles waltl TaxID=8319 RepID=A0AAV7SCR1_PLEWA|nr:hypothetical protein NDU88_003069 [Pleurodeles waltl]
MDPVGQRENMEVECQEVGEQQKGAAEQETGTMPMEGPGSSIQVRDVVQRIGEMERGFVESRSQDAADETPMTRKRKCDSRSGGCCLARHQCPPQFRKELCLTWELSLSIPGAKAYLVQTAVRKTATRSDEYYQ